MTIDGETNTIEDATVKAGEAVAIEGGNNTVSDSAEVTADAITMMGEAANTVTGEGTKLEATTDVTMNGGANTVTDGATVLAGNDVKMEGAGNEVTGGATVEAEGNVTIDGETNTIEDATVKAKTGDIKLDGDTRVEDSTVQAAQNVVVAEGTTAITNSELNAGKDLVVNANPGSSENVDMQVKDSVLTVEDKTSVNNAHLGISGAAKDENGVSKASDLGEVYLGDVSDESKTPGSLELENGALVNTKLLSVSDGSTAVVDASTLTATEGTTLNDGAQLGLVNGSTMNGTVTIASGATATLNMSNSTLDGSLVSQGSLVHFYLNEALPVADGSNRAAGDTLTLTGDFKPGSAGSMITHVDFGTTGADKLIVGGTALLNNSMLEVNFIGNEADLKDQFSTELIVGNVEGNFDVNIAHNLETLNIHTIIDEEGLKLVLSKNFKDMDEAGMDANQKAVNDVLNKIDDGGTATGNLSYVLDALRHTTDTEEVKKAMDSLGGEGLTTLMSSLLHSSTNHLRQLRSVSVNRGGNVVPMGDDGFFGAMTDKSVWFLPLANRHEISDDAVAPGYTRNGWGAMLGADAKATPNLTLGVAAGYEYGDMNSAALESDSDNYYVDFYAEYRRNKWCNRASIGLGQHDLRNDRSIYVGGTTPMVGYATGDTNAVTINFSYELSYAVKLSSISSVKPLFFVDSSIARMGGYTESGLGTAGLDVDTQNAWRTILGFGARYTKEFNLLRNAPDMATFTADATVTYDVGDMNSPIHANFIGASGSGFNLSPVDQSELGLLLGVGLNVPVTEKWTGFGGASVEFREGTRTFNANIGVRRAF